MGASFLRPLEQTLLRHHSSQEDQLWQNSMLSMFLSKESVVHMAGPVMLDSKTALEGK